MWVDIIEMSPSFRSQILHVRFNIRFRSFSENKKPCLHLGKQGLEKFYYSSVTCGHVGVEAADQAHTWIVGQPRERPEAATPDTRRGSDGGVVPKTTGVYAAI
jgi:hypothetical protein